MFCGCSTTFGAEPNTQTCPVCLGPARRAAGGQRRGDRVDDPHRARAGLPHRHLVPLLAEELLLPGHPQGLPDHPVRRAVLHRGSPGRRGRRRDLPRGDRAGAPRGGHRQEPARRWRHRPHPRRRPLADRLQPGRHPAGRDRHPADPGHRRQGARGRPRVRHRAARDPPGARGLRGPDGAGQPALRRQRLARADRQPRVGHPHRDQERQLAALGRAGGALRDAPPGRRSSTRAAGSCRRPGTSTRTPAAPRRAGARRRRPTTGTSPSPTSCRSPRTTSGSTKLAAALPELPAARRARLSRGVGDRPDRDGLAGQRRRGRAGQRHRRGRRLAGRRPQVVAGRAGPPRERRRRRAGRARGHARPRSPSWSGSSPPARSTTSWPGRPSTACWPARAIRRRSSSPAGWPSWASPTSWSPPSTPRSRATRTSPTRSAAARCRRSARWSARS